MYIEQQKFLEKLREIKNLSIIFGRLEKRKRDGKFYFVEKATDVNLALDLVLDAQADIYDEAFLISNDGDFSGAVKAVIERFNKKIIYVAIGNGKNYVRKFHDFFSVMSISRGVENSLLPVLTVKIVFIISKN